MDDAQNVYSSSGTAPLKALSFDRRYDSESREDKTFLHSDYKLTVADDPVSPPLRGGASDSAASFNRSHKIYNPYIGKSWTGV